MVNIKIAVKNGEDFYDTEAVVIVPSEINFSPKVSVIIPVYNVEEYLRDCLDSVVNQTLKEIEIICIDDGSTDNSLEILKEYAQKDKRFTVIKQQNHGASIARNCGLTCAKGEYVGFVDSDDWLDLNFYEVLYNKASVSNADIARTKYKYAYDNFEVCEQTLSDIIDEKIASSLDLNINDHSVVIWNALYRLKFLRENHIDYFDNIAGAHDIPFTARVTYYSLKTIPVDGTFYNYRKNIAKQLSTFSEARINYIKCSNKIALEFINSVEYQFENDYITAFKRCIWRYHYTFVEGLKLNGFTSEKQLELFKEMVYAIKTCKYLNLLCKNYNEVYYNYLITNDFDGYNDFVNNLYARNTIISLTSYPARISTVYKTIETLLNQSIHAEKVILALGEDEFPYKEKLLPKELLALTVKGLEILWCKDIKSYTKLIPTLKEYPDKNIVTADDDILYPYDWLEKLYRAYQEQPGLIHCHRIHRVLFDKNKKILPYNNWGWCFSNVKPSFNNFLTGVGGVFYPPNCFHNDIFKKDVFMELSPIADDIWFWAMAVLKGTKINVVKNNYSGLTYIDGTQENCLWKINVVKNQNDIQLQNILKQYPEILKKLDKRSLQEQDMKFLEQLFSVRNWRMPSSKYYKVITVFGLKIKFRDKKKERIIKRKKLYDDVAFCLDRIKDLEQRVTHFADRLN